MLFRRLWMEFPSLSKFLTRLRRFLFPRSIRLTPEGRRFLLMTMAVGVAAVNTGNNLFYLLLAMMLSLIIMSGVLSEQCLRKVMVRRMFPRSLFAREPATVHLVMANAKRLMPSYSMRIAEIIDGREYETDGHPFYIGPGASAARSYRAVFDRRGTYHVSADRLTTTFPFGLFIKSGLFPNAAELLVYPQLRPLPREIVQELIMIGAGREVNRVGAGSAMYNLREYIAGDDSRSIHWKTSARQGRLISKEYEAEDDRRMTIFFNNRRNPRLPATVAAQSGHDRARVLDEDFEEAVRLAASLANHVLGRHVAVRLLMLDHAVPFDVGRVQLHRILRSLALARLSRHDVDGEARRLLRDLAARRQAGELCVMVTPWEDPLFLRGDAPFSLVIRPTRVVEPSSSVAG